MSIQLGDQDAEQEFRALVRTIIPEVVESLSSEQVVSSWERWARRAIDEGLAKLLTEKDFWPFWVDLGYTGQMDFFETVAYTRVIRDLREAATKPEA